LAFTSDSHATPSKELEISLRWAPAIDVDQDALGYGVALTPTAEWACSRQVVTSELSYRSKPMAEGSWYGHVCAVDKSGHWSAVASTEPLIIDRTPPQVRRFERRSKSRNLESADGIVIHTSEALRGINEAGAFLLFASGPDGKFNTGSCDARPGDDDRAVRKLSLSPNQGQPGAFLDLTTAPHLQPGQYRLLICPDGPLTDEAGNSFSLDEHFDFSITQETYRIVRQNFETGDFSTWSSTIP
jgi:hypothetical protein